jgi:T5SS/PEP-CTERM-associated repeat protein
MRAKVGLCGVLVGGAIALGMFVMPTQVAAQTGDVDVIGNVWLSPDASGTTYTVYADDPFTDVNEGIPEGGNRIDPFLIPPALQIEFEGRPVGNTNVNFDIIVGRTSSGQLLLNSAQLRDQNLIIGDQGTINSQVRRGTGVVRIEGLGALYNNDPTIIPYLGPTQDPDNPVSPSQTPRPIDVGYDLYVGRFGTGVLELILGGQAEIQDAVIVGDQSGSIGTVIIDGFDSFLQSGGFETATPDPDEINYTIIGRLGSGTMNITHGGQAYNAGPVTGNGSEVTFGAVIGSNEAADTSAAPGPGGQGNVYVDGVSSKWTVAGNLQVGGFHDNRIGVFPLAVEDLEGNEAIYGSSVGRGTLKVSNGALVSVVTPPLDDSFQNVPPRLDMLVGHFGRVELDGGRIELLGVFDNTNPQTPNQELFRGRLINDGVITGNGTISTQQFRNRVLGEVLVNAGQSLIVEATGRYLQPDNIPLNTEPEDYPLANYGVIKALGTVEARAQLTFNRNHVTIPTATDFTRPFLNLPVSGPPIAPNGRTEGLIHAEYATLKFESGLWNRGVLAFTKGNNIVSGDVISFGESAPGAGDRGRVLIGPDTNVAFEDDFFTFGNTQISPGSTFQVLKGNSFAVGGDFTISVEGSPSGISFDPFQITGNASFGGNLNVNFLNGSVIPPFSSVPIFNVGGTLSGNFEQVTPSGLPFGSPIDFFTFVFGNQLYLAAFTVPAAGSGPDLNGDGTVDNLDFAIWKQNFGTAGPAGDINGDGIVDNGDFTIWRDNCCGPAPGAGSGGNMALWLGSGSSTAVPEPASACLMLGSVLALAMQRRRRN